MSDTTTAWLQTATGRAFPLLNPQPADIDIRDIAHALGMMCRFNGHCNEFYSVGEHSCHISDQCSPRNKLWGLLHDASEAYIADITRPLKPYLGNYYDHEARFMRAICLRFGLPEEMPREVKELDGRILNNEREQNMSEPPQPWQDTGVAFEGLTLQLWTPKQARVEFLDRFFQLYAGV